MSIMSKVVPLREERGTCPSCTDMALCVACYLDMRYMANMDEEREIELEGYGE